MKLIATLLLCLLMSLPARADRENGQMEIHPLSNGVWRHVSYMELEGIGYYPSNGLVVVEGDKAWIIDTPWPEADTPVLLDWIEEQGWTPAGAVATHFHDDRTAGFAELNRRGIPTWALPQTNRQLQQQQSATATHELSESAQGWPGDLLQWFYPGPGHAPDNIVIWLPGQQVLAGGCLVKSQASSTAGYLGDANLDTWADSMRAVAQQYPGAAIVVPGHGKPGDLGLLDHTIDLVEKARGE